MSETEWTPDEIKKEIEAIGKSVRESYGETRMNLMTKIETPAWYMYDKDLAAEAQGDVDFHLQHAISADNYKATIERGGSLPNLIKRARNWKERCDRDRE